MAENKKSFILYCDLIHEVDHLTFEEKGRLFQHLLEYVNDMNPIMDDRVLLGSWKHIERQLKRDLEKYDEIRERNRENARKRWDATASDRIRPNTKNADNDNDTDNGTVTVSPNGDGLKLKKKKDSEPKIPTLGQMIDYFTANGYPESLAKYVFGYYEKIRDGKGSVWKDTNGNTVKDWKAKMRVVWFKDENKTKFEKQNPDQQKAMTDEEYRAYIRRRHL